MSQPVTQADWGLFALLALFLVYGLSVYGLAGLWEPVCSNRANDGSWDDE